MKLYKYHTLSLLVSLVSVLSFAETTGEQGAPHKKSGGSTPTDICKNLLSQRPKDGEDINPWLKKLAKNKCQDPMAPQPIQESNEQESQASVSHETKKNISSEDKESQASGSYSGPGSDSSKKAKAIAH